MKLRLFAITAVIVLVFLLSGVTAVFAANPPGTGQPSQTCGSSTAMSSPGKASSAKGSAFNPNGVAPSVYAGTQSLPKGSACQPLLSKIWLHLYFLSYDDSNGNV